MSAMPRVGVVVTWRGGLLLARPTTAGIVDADPASARPLGEGPDPSG